MASRISPYVDNTGLVFAYDLANVNRSYLGEPTVNYLTTTLIPNSATKESFTGTVTENAELAPDGTYTAHRFQVDAGYTYQFLSIPANTTITYSGWVRSLDGNTYVNRNPYIWNYNSPTYGIVVQGTGGIAPEWRKFSMTYTTLAHQDTFSISYGSKDYSGLSGTYALWRPQLEYKTHSTPFVNGTRSATQGLKDLTGNSTIDLTNVSFDSNAQMTFDGTDDYITAGNNPYLAPGTGNFTYSCWINPAGYSYYAGLLVVATTGGLWIGKLGSNMVLRAYNVEDYLQYSTLPTVGQWTNVVITRAGTAVTLYYNANSVATATTGYNFVQATAYIGNDGPTSSANFNGKIANTSFYNRALTASEIQQNFNAIKGRYGL